MMSHSLSKTSSLLVFFMYVVLPTLVHAEGKTLPSNSPLTTPMGMTPATVGMVRAAVLGHVVDGLEMENVVVFFDHQHDHLILGTNSHLSGRAVFLYPLTSGLSEEVKDDNTTTKGLRDRIDRMLDDVYWRFPVYQHINIILLCSGRWSRLVLQQANAFDQSNARTTALHLRSRWLMALVAEDHGAFLLSIDKLDNLAFIDLCSGRWRGTNSTHEGYLCQPPSSKTDFLCFSYPIKTLRYRQKRIQFLSHIGWVSVNTGVSWRGADDNILFPNIYLDFKGRRLVVGTVEEEPFVISHKEGNHTLYDGLCLDVLRRLGVALDFTVEILPVQLNDGRHKLSGTVGDIQDNLGTRTVDIISGIQQTSQGTHKLQLVFPFYTDDVTVLLKRPGSEDEKWSTLTLPLQWEVHLVTVISLVLITLLGYALERFNPFYWSHAKCCLHTVLGSLLFMYGSLLTQGRENLPSSMAGRTLVIGWCLFSVVLVATYAGNLTAFFTVSKDVLPFQSVEGMLNQDKYKYGLIGGSVIQKYFQDSTETSAASIWSQIVRFNRSDPRVLSPDPRVHYQMVKAGQYAFIGRKSMTETWQKQDCSFISLKKLFFPIPYGFAMNNMAYSVMVNEEMLRVFESGIMKVLETKWWPEHIFCKGSLVTESTSISLADVQSAFYLLACGVVLSCFALVAEYFGPYLVSLGRWSQCTLALPDNRRFSRTKESSYSKKVPGDRGSPRSRRSSGCKRSLRRSCTGGSERYNVDVNGEQLNWFGVDNRDCG